MTRPQATIAIGAMFIACGTSESPSPPLAATVPNVDAGPSPLDAAAPYVPPPWRPREPPECVDLETCAEDDDVFTQVFEAPEGVELRQASDEYVLGYDTIAKRFLRYTVRGEEGQLPGVLGPSMLDAAYENVTIGGGWTFGTSTSSGSEITGLFHGVHRIPDDVAATTYSKECVGGRGLWCVDSNGWGWRVRPERFATPIAHLAGIHDRGVNGMLIIETGGNVSMLSGGTLQPFDLGTAEPVVSLTAGSLRLDAEWAAITSSGNLVRGTLAGAHACSTTVDFGGLSYRLGLTLQRGERLFFASHPSTCRSMRTPPGIIGHGAAGCGIDNVPFVIDARRVYALPLPLPCHFD